MLVTSFPNLSQWDNHHWRAVKTWGRLDPGFRQKGPTQTDRLTGFRGYLELRVAVFLVKQAWIVMASVKGLEWHCWVTPQELGSRLVKSGHLWRKASSQDVTFLEKGRLALLARIKLMLCLCTIMCQFPAAQKGLKHTTVGQNPRCQGPESCDHPVNATALNTGWKGDNRTKSQGLFFHTGRKEAPSLSELVPVAWEHCFHPIYLAHLFALCK